MNKTIQTENSIQFLGYIKKVINYKAIKIKKQIQCQSSSEMLILNATDNVDVERINSITDPSLGPEECTVKQNLDSLSDYIDNKQLCQCISHLTPKQKQILYDLYINEIPERELAESYHTSFQNINKTKNTALQHIREDLSLMNTSSVVS